MRTTLALFKFRYHLSFAAVVAGAALFGAAAESLPTKLAALYVSFNLLLYGGIYTLNDLADRAGDVSHPGKRFRPVASGRVTPQAALAIALLLVIAGLSAAAVMFPASIWVMHAGALGINLAYSFGGRNIAYLDIVLNSAPHPLRFLMGVLLVDRTPPVGHLLAWFCLAAGVACVRRIVEKETAGADARPTLRFYSIDRLRSATDAGLAVILVLALVDRLRSPGFYLVVMTAYGLLVLAGRRAGPVRAGLARLWLH